MIKAMLIVLDYFHSLGKQLEPWFSAHDYVINFMWLSYVETEYIKKFSKTNNWYFHSVAKSDVYFRNTAEGNNKCSNKKEVESERSKILFYAIWFPNEEEFKSLVINNSLDKYSVNTDILVELKAFLEKFT